MADEETEKAKRVGLSGPEAMFFDLADAAGVTVEARIVPKVKDWEDEMYSYQLTFLDGSKIHGIIPWDMSTFASVAAVIKDRQV